MVKSNNIKLLFDFIRTIAILIVASLSITFEGINNTASAVTWYVSNEGLETNGGTNWDDAFATIQQGVTAASDGEIVLVADGTYTGDGNKNIEIQGKAIIVESLNGPENCVIDCENSGRGFFIHEDETFDTIISGFTIVNGNAGSNYYGGAIYCYSSTPTIDNCILKNNNGNYGGGIGLLYAGATVTSCRIINNSSQYGGGIYSVFPWFSTDNLIVVNSILSGNVASGRGGAILFGGPFSGAYMKVINSTIVGNTAVNGGGFSLESCASETITNSILAGNTPDAIWINDCYPLITYTAGSGYGGQGNIEEVPLFMNLSDPDPENWDLRLQAYSPCIDAGNNFVTEIATQDLDAKPRFIDGDGDMTAKVDLGAYEHGNVCECDTFMDLDTDGLDLADYISDPGNKKLSILAEDFGRADCPNYRYIP